MVSLSRNFPVTRVVTVYRYGGLLRYWHVRLSYRAHLLIRGKKKTKPEFTRAAACNFFQLDCLDSTHTCTALKMSETEAANLYLAPNFFLNLQYGNILDIRKTIVVLSLKMDIQFARYVDEEWLQKEETRRTCSPIFGNTIPPWR